jgi:hypothetical protein
MKNHVRTVIKLISNLAEPLCFLTSSLPHRKQQTNGSLSNIFCFGTNTSNLLTKVKLEVYQSLTVNTFNLPVAHLNLPTRKTYHRIQFNVFYDTT